MFSLLKAYFSDGKYLDVKDVVEIAKANGLDGAIVKKMITDPEKLEEVHEKAKNFSRMGISGKKILNLYNYRSMQRI